MLEVTVTWCRWLDRLSRNCSHSTAPFSCCNRGPRLWLHESKAPMTYPYIDAYYGGIIAAYGDQPMMHPCLMGIVQLGVPLPTDTVEEHVYVNAKQYHGILRHRQSRAKAELENKLIKSRKYRFYEAFVAYAGCNAILAAAAAALYTYIAPPVARSGIPEVKAYLNGVDAYSILAPSTLFVKIPKSSCDL